MKSFAGLPFRLQHEDPLSAPSPPPGSVAPPHSGEATKILFTLGGIVGLAAPLALAFGGILAGALVAATGMMLLGAGAIVHANFDG